MSKSLIERLQKSVDRKIMTTVLEGHELSIAFLAMRNAHGPTDDLVVKLRTKVSEKKRCAIKQDQMPIILAALKKSAEA